MKLDIDITKFTRFPEHGHAGAVEEAAERDVNFSYARVWYGPNGRLFNTACEAALAFNKERRAHINRSQRKELEAIRSRQYELGRRHKMVKLSRASRIVNSGHSVAFAARAVGVHPSTLSTWGLWSKDDARIYWSIRAEENAK